VCVNEECGFEPDNCGGLVSCGDCPPQTPYCAGEVTPAGFEHLCSATMPVYCPNGEGITWGGCIPCTQTIACTTCHDGVCLGIQDECLCQRGG